MGAGIGGDPVHLPRSSSPLRWFLPPVKRRSDRAAVTYAGVALVASRYLGGENANFFLGAMLVFGSATAYAVYLVIGSHVVHSIGSMRFAAYATSVAGVMAILQFFALRPMSALDLPWQVYGLAVLIAVVSTVIPIFMTAEALKRIGANDVAMIGALGPVPPSSWAMWAWTRR
jgi:drug/metabolite transporter (DMT)-like permease